VSPMLTEQEIGSLAQLSWYCLSYNDDAVVQAASTMVMLQAQLLPSKVRELICTDMYSQEHDKRKAGLVRFGSLWAQRRRLSMIYTVMFETLKKPAMPELVVGVSLEEECEPEPGCILPPILGVAASPIIDLCLDSSAEVSQRARKLLMSCLANDPELFLRVTFEQVGRVNDMAQAQMLARVIRITQSLLTPPDDYCRLMFNFIIQLTVEKKINGSSATFPFEAMRTISVLSGLVTHMHGLRLRHIRAQAHAPFVLQLFDVDMLELSESRDMKTAVPQQEILTLTKTKHADTFILFPNIADRPVKYAPNRNVHLSMNFLVHHSKLLLAARIIENFPREADELKSKVYAELHHILQESLHDLYSQRMDETSYSSGKRLEPEKLIEYMKSRMVPAIHEILLQTSPDTVHLWLMIARMLLPYWNDCEFDDSEHSVHVLILLLVSLNIIILRHHTQLQTCIEVVTLYCQFAIMHYRFFREDGYRHILAPLVKVYALSDDNPEIKDLIQHAFGHFYRIHGQLFLLQILTALAPSIAGPGLAVDGSIILNLVASVRQSNVSEKWADICWSPEVSGDLHFSMEEFVQMQVCLIVYSPTCSGTGILVEMLCHLVPALENLHEWKASEGKKFIQILSRLFESLDPDQYNIRFEAVPMKYKISLFQILQRLGYIEPAMYLKYHPIIHKCAFSTLASSIESGENDALEWLDTYCHNFIVHLNKNEGEALQPMSSFLPELFKVYELCPLWTGWGTVFHGVSTVLKAHPYLCLDLSHIILDTMQKIVLQFEQLDRGVLLTACEVFGFCLTHQIGIKSYVPTTPLIVSAAENHEDRAKHLLFNVVVPMAHSMSVKRPTEVEKGWSWVIACILQCLHQGLAKEEALLALQVALLFGHHNLGSWSASIATTVATMLSQENALSANYVSSSLKTFFQFCVLLKPNVYVNLVTFIRRLFPPQFCISWGSGKLPLATALNQSPRTTTEMWAWLEPTLLYNSRGYLLPKSNGASNANKA